MKDNIALWSSGDAGFDAANPFRNSLAQYFLPSHDEWYKAAYYDPGTSTYFDYPTGSDTAPTAVAICNLLGRDAFQKSCGTTAGTAVYGQSWLAGPADITNAGGLSPYGVMGLGGNVWEWEESEFDLVNNSSTSTRGLRGGAWVANSFGLSSSFRLDVDPADVEDVDVGFRVAGLSSSAAVPEPSSLILLGIGGIALIGYGARRKRQQAA